MYLVTFASLVACVVSVFSLGVFWCFVVDAATEPCWGSLPLMKTCEIAIWNMEKCYFHICIKLKEGIPNKAPLQHPQQNTKTPQVRTQIQHTQPRTQRLQAEDDSPRASSFTTKFFPMFPTITMEILILLPCLLDLETE